MRPTKKASPTSAASKPDDLAAVLQAHRARMAAKPAVRVLRAPPRDEATLHADVLRAVDEGRLTMLSPGGVLREALPTVNDSEAAAPAIDLSSVGARVAAYRALGCTMLPVPAALGWRARDLIAILETVAGAGEAPEHLIVLATRAVETMLAPQAGTGAEPWMFVLAGIFATPLPERERLTHVLIALQTSAPSLPPSFTHPKDETLTKAKRLLRDLRVTNGRAGKAGVTPWGAAVKFAAAFGQIIPAKESAARRTKETRRKRAR